MDSFDDDKIARLLRLKRYEQPPPGYFENFLHEFRRRRQRDEFLREPLWSICADRVRDFVFRHNVRTLAGYSAGVAVAAACVAVIAITIQQQPETITQLAVQTPVPNTPPIMAIGLDAAPPVFNALSRFDIRRPILLRRSRHVPVPPARALHSDDFLSLELESESLEDQSPVDE